MRYFADPDRGLNIADVNRAVEAAFADHGKGLVQMPPKVYITLPAGDFRTMPAYLPSLGIAGVKVVNVHPDNPKVGLPTVMALTIILDTATGIPTAILNATRLTDMRTGAAGAIAAKYLAPRKDCVLGVIGTAGRQKRRSGPPYRNSPSPVSGSGAGIPFMLNLLPDGLPPLPQKVYLSKKPATAMSLSPRHHPAHPLLKANGYMQVRTSMQSAPMRREKRSLILRSCTGPGSSLTIPLRHFTRGK